MFQRDNKTTKEWKTMNDKETPIIVTGKSVKSMKEYRDFRTAVERLMVATFRLKGRKTHMVTT
jgi:hypothetical protein